VPGTNRLERDSFVDPRSFFRFLCHQQTGQTDSLQYISASYERILMKLFGGLSVAQGPILQILTAISMTIGIQGSWIRITIQILEFLKDSLFTIAIPL